MTKDKKRYIILGAGPIGLVTGLFLSQKKKIVQIYDMKNQVGGMCRSWKWDDFFVDTGPHIFHTSDNKLWKLWRNLFKKNFIKGTYRSKNVIGNSFDLLIDYPLSKEAINQFPKQTKKIILDELKKLKTFKNNEAKNFKDYIINQVGPTLQKLFYEGYPQKVWGLKTTDMTAEWAPKRIQFTNKSIPFFNKEKTAVGKFGTGHLYEIIKKKIIKNGGTFFLKHQVNKFVHENFKIKFIEFSNGKKVKINSNDIIISSLPINLTAKLLGYKSDLKFRGVRSVYVALNKKRCFPKNVNWLYFQSEKIIFNRVSEPKTMSKSIAPKNKTYLCVEITYSKNDKIDKLSFNKIKKIIVNDLIKTNLISSKNDVTNISENKEDIVYPVQFTNYKKLLEDTKINISKYSQIYSLGTGGDFDYADSQILFNKSMDLVKILTDKFNAKTNVRRNEMNNTLNSIVNLKKIPVGHGYKPYIIAEAGLNHNGDINLAKKLIDSAHSAGCDAIKFQTYQKDSRVSSKVKSVNYVEKADGLREDINEFFNRVRIDEKFHRTIFNYSKKKNLSIFSTAFDEPSVDFLEKLNVSFYKIASADAVNLPLIKKVGNTGKPLILSTGMCNIGNVHDAVEIFKNTGNKNLILLHCLSSYPAHEKEMNLNAIKTMQTLFNIPVGLSDHYPGNEISIMSLGLGANIIEKHFTLDKNFEGPDHILSADENEMVNLVHFAKNRDEILGTGEKKIQPSEYDVINSQRKSIYAKKNIKKGEKFSKSNLCIKGPAGGILPKYIDVLMGKKCLKSIQADFPITWSDF